MPQNPVIVRRASLATGSILCKRPFQISYSGLLYATRLPEGRFHAEAGN